ncbi:hypothetical protein AB0C59_24945 [Streptomyces sp. NPDC048664]|uniref:hypothetical protein n=1 Tax=Streptomyces sp. NPDC048664 TaxID=3154505 RepID=UPI003438AB75
MIRTTARAAVRARRTALLALGAGAALTLSACGPLPGTDSAADGTETGKGPAPRGVITQAAAKTVVDTYEKANNRANTARSEKIEATVEAGQRYEMDRSDYKLYPTWTAKEKKGFGGSFVYGKRAYYIPRAGTASWFAVTATASTDHAYDALLFFDKVDGAYKLTMSFYTPKKQPLPKIAVDRYGFAQVADQSRKVGALSPSELGSVYEDFYESGGTKKAARAFVANDFTKESVKVHAERENGNLKNYVDQNFFGKPAAHPAGYALQVAGGGVLAGFPTAHTKEKLLKPKYMSGFDINPSPEEAVFNPGPHKVMTNEFQGAGLAKMTPNGKPEVVELQYRFTNSH